MHRQLDPCIFPLVTGDACKEKTTGHAKILRIFIFMCMIGDANHFLHELSLHEGQRQVIDIRLLSQVHPRKKNPDFARNY